LRKAANVAQTYLEPELLDTQLRDGSRLGDNPKIIKAFANIANLLSEDKIIGTEAENILQGRDVEKEIDDLTTDKNGPYWNKNHPSHNKVVNQVLALREMLSQ
jgi:DNA-binding ferritin-like protein (Dps family)